MESEEKNKVVSMLVWLCITLFYCYQLVLRMLPNAIMTDIMTKYSIGASEFGSFAGIYYIGYIIVHIPVGMLLSRFGGKIVLPIAIACTALGLIPLVYFDSWTSVIIGRVLTGVGSSAAIVGALQIFRILYPAKFSRMLGFMVFFGLITAVYAGVPISQIIQSIGMDYTVSILLYSGIVLAFVTYVLMPKSTNTASESSMLGDIKAIIFNYRLFFTSIFAGLMVGPVEGFADAWGSAFLINVYGIEKTIANSITLSVLLGMCAGCIILPYIAEKTKLYFGVTIFSGLVMILGFVYILNGKASADSLYYACIIIGVFCAYQVVIIAKIASFVSSDRSGMAAAIANMIIMFFGWVFHNSIGMRLDSLWDGEMLGDMKIYSADAFISSISIIPAAISIAIVGLVIIAMSNIVRVRLAQKVNSLK
ncbi:MAG: MFS transporter [Rickettsiales bacterium]|nr:MAG: MFS transporter [Rickettsiales bacterium]